MLNFFSKHPDKNNLYDSMRANGMIPPEDLKPPPDFTEVVKALDGVQPDSDLMGSLDPKTTSKLLFE